MQGTLDTTFKKKDLTTILALRLINDMFYLRWYRCKVGQAPKSHNKTDKNYLVYAFAKSLVR